MRDHQEVLVVEVQMEQVEQAHLDKATQVDQVIAMLVQLPQVVAVQVL
jgi:hypothetical protein